MERTPITRWLPHLVATVFVLCGLLVGTLIHFYANQIVQAAKPHYVINRPEYIYAGAVNKDRTFPCQTTNPATCFGRSRFRPLRGCPCAGQGDHRQRAHHCDH